MEIKYRRKVEYMGKNAGHIAVGMNIGYGIGVGVTRLVPIHSRHGSGHCFIEIPDENLPELISELQNRLVNHMSKSEGL